MSLPRRPAGLPNRLTIFRILLTFVFILFALREGVISKIIAAVIFLLASLTDFYDGYYAKKYNLISDFGKIMDPIADKLLVLTAFFAFMVMHLIQAWMFIVILVREVTVTLVRLQAMKRGKVLAAEQAGKIKTVLQVVTISIILIFMVFAQTDLPRQWSAFLGQFHQWVIDPLMFVVVVVTLFSGVSFLWNNRRSMYA